MTEQNNTKVTYKYKSIVEKLVSGRLREYIEDEEFCIPCDNHVYDTEDDLSNHSEDCPYRQAVVELLADDSITVDKLVDLGFRERNNINDEFLGYTYNNFDVFFVRKSDKLDKVLYNYEETKVENMTDLCELIRLLG